MAPKKITLDNGNMTVDELLNVLRSNPEILLMRGDAPVAHIASVVANPQPRQRVLGLHEGAGWISDDFTDALPTTFWTGEDA